MSFMQGNAVYFYNCFSFDNDFTRRINANCSKRYNGFVFPDLYYFNGSRLINLLDYSSCYPPR